MTSDSAREVAREMAELSRLVEEAAPFLTSSDEELASRLEMVRGQAQPLRSDPTTPGGDHG